MFKLGQVFIYIGLFIAFGYCQAQKSILVGELKDDQTDEPLAYAHIIFTKTKYGTTSNEQGRFFLQVDSTLLREDVRISSLGYQSKVMPSYKLSNKTTFLSPKIEALNEVVVYDRENKNNSRTLNPFSGKQWVGLGNFSGGAYPSVLARYYPNDFKGVKKLYLDQVTIYFNPPYHVESKFKLRVLGVNNDLSPAEDLLLSNLIVHSKKNQRKAKVSLSEFGIEVPEKGFYIAVEHLFIQENQFEERFDVRLGDTVYQDVKTIRYGPIFRGVQEKPEDVHAYYRSNVGWKSMDNLKLTGDGNTFKNGKIVAPAFKVKVVY